MRRCSLIRCCCCCCCWRCCWCCCCRCCCRAAAVAAAIVAAASFADVVAVAAFALAAAAAADVFATIAIFCQSLVPTITCTSSNVLHTVLQAFSQVHKILVVLFSLVPTRASDRGPGVISSEDFPFLCAVCLVPRVFVSVFFVLCTVFVPLFV